MNPRLRRSAAASARCRGRSSTSTGLTGCGSSASRPFAAGHAGGDDLHALEALARKWREVEAGQDAYIATLTPERLAEPLAYVSFSGDRFTRVLGDALLHLANHGTYHRGQVATLLRHLGRKATPTDYLRFIDAQKS